MNQPQCPFCNTYMTPSGSIGYFCNNHDDVMVLNIGAIALCKDGFEIFLGAWNVTQFNLHKSDMLGKFDYFNEPSERVITLPYLISVTPDNFDEWVERLKRLTVFL